ncbi:MAG: sirohydrochlorin chelatase, partial [Planctomycetia bacterium]
MEQVPPQPRPPPAANPPESADVLPSFSAGAASRLIKRSFGGLFRRHPAVAAPAPFSHGREAAGRRPGLVVVGHGTADPVGAEETRQVAEWVAGLLPGVAVELGFLEVIGPSIGTALERLADRGCAEVVAAPLLLFTAGHARRDVPEAVREAADRLGLAVRQSDALGCHPGILSLTR